MTRPPRVGAPASRRIGRRTLVLGALQLGVAGVLGARMHRLQVDEADQYRLLAEENRINMRLLPPARGAIFDRSGRLVAGNGQNYRVVIVREDAGDLDETLARLQSRCASIRTTSTARAARWSAARPSCPSPSPTA